MLVISNYKKSCNHIWLIAYLQFLKQKNRSLKLHAKNLNRTLKSVIKARFTCFCDSAAGLLWDSLLGKGLRYLYTNNLSVLKCILMPSHIIFFVINRFHILIVIQILWKGTAYSCAENFDNLWNIYIFINRCFRNNCEFKRSSQ